MGTQQPPPPRQQRQRRGQAGHGQGQQICAIEGGGSPRSHQIAQSPCTPGCNGMSSGNQLPARAGLTPQGDAGDAAHPPYSRAGQGVHAGGLADQQLLLKHAKTPIPSASGRDCPVQHPRQVGAGTPYHQHHRSGTCAGQEMTPKSAPRALPEPPGASKRQCLRPCR